MNLISTHELATLAAETKTTCVSIYLPMERLGIETQQNPIRFKNAMREAEAQLMAAGLRPQEVRDLMERAQSLDDYEFWQHQEDGLALFLSPNLFQSYRLPIDVPELVVVTERFHLKPLLSLLTGDGQFYILALSQNQVRLFQGTRFSVSEIQLEEMPTSMAEALKYDDPEKSIQFHTSTSQTVGGGDRSAMFHGQGVGEDDQNDNLLRYFRKVNEGIQELLKDQQAPLVLAGVEYLFPIYQQANTHPKLLGSGISGNPEILKPEELHNQAWQIVQPYFEQSLQDTIAQYQASVAAGQATDELQKVVAAAYYHQVDSLIVPVGQQQWGVFDPGTGEVQIHTSQEPGDEDLLDLAALHTLMNGGTVYAVEPEQVPGEAAIAAVLRY